MKYTREKAAIVLTRLLKRHPNGFEAMHIHSNKVFQVLKQSKKSPHICLVEDDGNLKMFDYTFLRKKI